MDIKALLRDYGAAIGPTLAFALGFVALILKYRFDALSARWTARRLVSNLHKLILDSPPPEFEQHDSTKRYAGVGALEIRNLWWFTVYHNRLLAVQSVLASIEPRVNEHGAPYEVARLHQIKWAFGNLIRKVEESREKGASEAEANYGEVQSAWKALVETGSGEGAYVYRKRRTRKVPT